MAIQSFQKYRVVSEDLNLVQDACSLVFRDIVRREVIDGILIKEVSLLASKTNLVSHGLNREPQGYIVVKRDADCRIWDTGESVTPKKTIGLKTSADVTVNLWVF